MRLDVESVRRDRPVPPRTAPASCSPRTAALKSRPATPTVSGERLHLPTAVTDRDGVESILRLEARRAARRALVAHTSWLHSVACRWRRRVSRGLQADATSRRALPTREACRSAGSSPPPARPQSPRRVRRHRARRSTHGPRRPRPGTLRRVAGRCGPLLRGGSTTAPPSAVRSRHRAALQFSPSASWNSLSRSTGYNLVVFLLHPGAPVYGKYEVASLGGPARGAHGGGCSCFVGQRGRPEVAEAPPQGACLHAIREARYLVVLDGVAELVIDDVRIFLVLHVPVPKRVVSARRIEGVVAYADASAAFRPMEKFMTPAGSLEPPSQVLLRAVGVVVGVRLVDNALVRAAQRRVRGCRTWC